jgi:hypothetical protein
MLLGVRKAAWLLPPGRYLTKSQRTSQFSFWTSTGTRSSPKSSLPRYGLATLPYVVALSRPLQGVVSACGEIRPPIGESGEMKKKMLLPLVALMLFSGCARPLTMKNEHIPPPPSAQAIWVYGHYNPQGKWVPGKWIE